MSSDTKKNGSLSFSKLAQLLNSKSYMLVAIYSEGKSGFQQSIRFLEVRTPKIQKTFLISIPEKYKMHVNDDAERYRNIFISKIEGGSEERQIEYIAEIKGPLLECDLLSISSSSLCLTKNNGDIELYKFGNDASQDFNSPDDSDIEEDPIENIIKSVKKISKKVGSKKFKMPKEDLEVPNREEKPVENTETVQEPDGNVEADAAPVADEIELVFEDENGNEITGEDTQTLMEEEIVIPAATKRVEEEIEKLETAVERVEPEIKQKKESRKTHTFPEKLHKTYNSVPKNIEDLDITLGIIYYCIEIGLFNKKITRIETPAVKTGVIPSFEEEVVNIYDTIDDNESELRDIRLDEITELSSKLTIKAKEEMDACRKEEMNLKSQILKLTSVLDHCEKLRIKTENKPDKFTEFKPEIDKLYKQTKTTLYEINVEILRNKDRADDILSQYQTSLQELLAL